LLRLILDSHPHIAVPEETGFMRAVEATLVIPGWKYGASWYERLGFDEETFVAHVRGFYGQLFEHYAASQGKRRWGEKTPFHVAYLPQMSLVFPDAAFVAIVRHPAAVVNSLTNRWGYGLDDAITLWRDRNLTILANGVRIGPQFALCRYEDLVHEPEATLGALVSFLEEPWSDHLLAHHTAQREKGAPRTVDGGTRPSDPIDAARAESWTNQLTGEQLRTIEDQVGDLAAFLGYDVGSATPIERLCGAGSAETVQIVRGDQLEALRVRHPRRTPPFDVTAPSPSSALRELTRDQLEERLLRSEKSLARLQGRRAVRLADALNRLRRANSLAEARHAVSGVRFRKYR
jgi:hypothetical protein